jgi:hypothetical protein
MRVRSWSSVLLLVAAMAAPLHAEPAPSRPVLAVQVSAERDEAAALDGVLRDVVSGLPIDLDVAVVARIDPGTLIHGAGADRSHPPLGRAFVDLSDAARVTVYVVDGTWQRVLVRHVPRTSNPDVDRETVGRIVSTAVEALLAGSFVAYSQPVAALAPPAADERPPPAAPRPRPRLAGCAGLMYEASLLARGPAWAHGPAVYGAATFGEGSLRPAIWLTAQRRWPVFGDDPPIGFRLDTTALRLLGGIDLDLSPAVTLEIGLGAGLDLLHVEPRSTTRDVRTWLAADRSLVVGLARAMIGARWRLSGSFSAHALVVADVDASETRLLFDGTPDSEPILALWAVRPGMALTVSVP